MTDRGIIFSAPMVHALLEGRKTQTLRLETSPLRRCEPGDRLYVREAWAPNEGTSGGVIYRSDHGGADGITVYDLKAGGRPTTHVSRWRPSIHMPRCASRLTLIVENLKVERLQEISEADAIAEGLTPAPMANNMRWKSVEDGQLLYDRAVCAYAELWDSLHTDPGTRWGGNPFVVALTFRVVRGNIDTLGG